MNPGAARDHTSGDSADVARVLAEHLRPGALVALADGAGAPRTLAAALPEAARRVGGGVRVFTGWWLQPPFATDPAAFADVATYLGGYGFSEDVSAGAARYVPCRLSALPKLMHGVARPDVVLISARPSRDGLSLCTEVGWMMAAIDTGATLIAEVNDRLPIAAREAEIPLARVAATVEVSQPALELPTPESTDALRALGERVARLIPAGASVQIGPGAVGHATLAALTHSVSIDSGLLTDGVVDLDRRGLLERVVAATYAVGTELLYDWLTDRRVLVRIEQSHDLGRLMREPLIAVNTALEVDITGAVNVESVNGRPIAGVGGHPDYALAASLAPNGLSVIALPSMQRGRPTLVRELSGPVTTSRVDVDVVVTELGAVDLRGCDDRQRERALRQLWGDALAED